MGWIAWGDRGWHDDIELVESAGFIRRKIVVSGQNLIWGDHVFGSTQY